MIHKRYPIVSLIVATLFANVSNNSLISAFSFDGTMTNTVVTPLLQYRVNHRVNFSTRYITRASNAKETILKAVEGDFDPEAISRSVAEAKSGSLKARVRALYKFIRPHTIRGTILGSIAGTSRVLIDTPGAIAKANWGILIPRALIGVISLLLGNVFIVGINQIYDKEIDEMNKPFLPVASGEMSKRFAWLAVISSAIVGPLLVAKAFPLLLFKLYMVGIFLGTIYSVPPIRAKQNPVLAGLIIATVRGFLLNFGVYYAVKDAVGAPFSWSPKVSFIARFMTVFATVIAVTKDLPDTEGDKAYNISTFATKVGVDKIAKGATVCLLINYIHAIATGVISSAGTFNSIPMIGGHLGLATILMARYSSLDASSMDSIKKFYKHIWDLFYLEYGLYILI